MNASLEAAEAAQGAEDKPALGANGQGPAPAICGPAALYFAAKRAGAECSYADVEARVKITDEGSSILQLQEGARGLGLAARAYEIDGAARLASLGEGETAIILIEQEHFVAVWPEAGESANFQLASFPEKTRSADADEIDKAWKKPKIALVIQRAGASEPWRGDAALRLVMMAAGAGLVLASAAPFLIRLRRRAA